MSLWLPGLSGKARDLLIATSHMTSLVTTAQVAELSAQTLPIPPQHKGLCSINCQRDLMLRGTVSKQVLGLSESSGSLAPSCMFSGC